MGKIKHNEAINILQMILAFIQGIVEMCRKNENDNENENDNGNYYGKRKENNA